VKTLKGDMVVFTGLDKNRDKYYGSMRILLPIGFAIIAIGFALQVIASPTVWKLITGQSS
jgi:hypothetical protein